MTITAVVVLDPVHVDVDCVGTRTAASDVTKVLPTTSVVVYTNVDVSVVEPEYS